MAMSLHMTDFLQFIFNIRIDIEIANIEQTIAVKYCGIIIFTTSKSTANKKELDISLLNFIFASERDNNRVKCEKNSNILKAKSNGDKI